MQITRSGDQHVIRSKCCMGIINVLDSNYLSEETTTNSKKNASQKYKQKN